MAQLLENTHIYQDKTTHTKEPVHKGKVLIVDDDVDVVNAMQAYLTAATIWQLDAHQGKTLSRN